MGETHLAQDDYTLPIALVHEEKKAPRKGRIFPPSPCAPLAFGYLDANDRQPATTVEGLRG